MVDQLIFDRSRAGKRGAILPRLDVEARRVEELFSQEELRKWEAKLPEVTEAEVVRHYTNLSTKNHHVDKDVYPLGSCTMKYNPKANEAAARLAGFQLTHPRQPEETMQGALAVMAGLEKQLCAITGMTRFTLQPSAGSQGELVGVLIMHRYHELRGAKKKSVLIPDTAHGTNAASVAMAGYEVVQVASNARGRIDLDDLKRKLSAETAGMMLTQPNTLGLFEDEIAEISRLVHASGGLMYMDGANLNALVGLVYPVDMGFDIVHVNLHKTFSTPHGGGGPGAGPIGVVEELADFLPVPLVEEVEGRFRLVFDLPHSIGRVHAFFGNFGILLRAHAYISMLGRDGIRAVARQAILNANYLKTLVSPSYELYRDEPCMHEFVVSTRRQRERGVKALDIAKRLLDFGFHAPTVYFPLVVPEAMMIEPTESETEEGLERFAEALLRIDEESMRTPSTILEAPTMTPVRRLDEAAANRAPNLRWEPKQAGQR